MANNARIITVFIASPGDLADERKKLSEFLEQNRNIEGVRFDSKRWETDIPATTLENGMSVQEYIDTHLVECDLAIVMFKSRFGTKTSSFSSGTEEEFYTALANRMPVIVYYFFHSVDTNCSVYEAEQFNYIRSFRQKTRTIVYPQDVTDIDDLLSRLNRDLKYNISKLLSSSTAHKEVYAQDNVGGSSLPVGFVKMIDGKPTVLWDDYISLIRKLDYMLKKSQSEGGFAFDVIIAVNKCGLITGTLLGRLQGNSKQVFCIFSDNKGNFGGSINRGAFLTNAYVINAIKNNPSIKNILVVDTINRHSNKVAKAFKYVIRALRGANRQIKTAVLINNRNAEPLNCDYVVYDFDGDDLQLPYNSVLEAN